MSPRTYRGRISSAAQVARARATLAAGLRIRDARRRRQMTIGDLANRAGVSPAVIVGIEAGDAASVETYARLGSALGLHLEVDFVDPRRRESPRDDADLVHAAMGEMEARRLRSFGLEVGIDVPYQHFQFAGRADVVAWDIERRALLHVENRTRFPDLQDAFGRYNAKRAYLGGELAERVGLRGGWRSETHALAVLWSAEVLHTLRLRPASFEAVCPDPPDAFAAWWAGEPPASDHASTLVILDPATHLATSGAAGAGRRRAAFRSFPDARRIEPRYRDYAAAAAALRAGVR